MIAQGKFSNIEKDISSTHRKLLAVLYTIQSFHNLLGNESIQWYSDNSNACRIIAVGSPKRDLQQLVRNIFELCLNNNISIHPVWVPREGNKFTDYLSKYTDSDDWSINNVTFQYIQRTLGLCTIDRFADGNNSKLRRFNSKLYCPHSECVNAFTSDWSSDFNWLCPPISLVGNAIKHLKFCNARGTLIIPEWPSAYYWPLLFNGFTFRSFVTQTIIIAPYYRSASDSSVFKGYPNFRTLAVLIDFT